MDYNIKKLLNTDVSDLRASLRNSSGNIQVQMNKAQDLLWEYESAIDKADLDVDDRNKLILRANVVTNILNELQDQGQRHAQALVNGTTSSGGRVLDKDGRIKAYAPDEKIAQKNYADDDLSLGAFLRAAVDRPRNSKERELIQNATGSDGIELPSFVSDELIDKLRATNPVVQAGARTLTIEGLDGTSFVRITGDSTGVWHAELATETPTDPTLDAVALVPKTVLALTEVSREVLQDSANIEEALEATFTGSINQAILDATFGTTTTNGPTGLGSIVTAVEEYANAGSPAYSNFVNANKVLFDNNVPQDTRAHLLAPDVWQDLNNGTDSTGQPLRKPFGILEIPEFTSSGVPVKTAYAGDFSNVVYGFRLNISIERFPGAAATKYASLWMAAARMDMVVFRPSAFVRIQEASV